jgi:CRISPR/Cas system-associated exonuclease Cas4 (RecB family)
VDKAERRQDVIHPSEMCKDDWCPRQTYLRIDSVRKGIEIPATKDHAFQMQTIFQEGHDVHTKFQTWLAEMGRMFGTWEHVTTGERWTGTMSAEQFATGEWRYKEVSLNSEEKYLISGHGDGAVIDLTALIEVKTIGMGTLRMEEPAWLNRFLVTTEDGKTLYDLDKAWKDLRRPLNTHIKQTNIYGVLANEQGLELDKVIFFYEYKANQGVKEFVIKLNPALVQDLFDTALDIKHALATGNMPPKPPHTAVDAKVCKECPFFKQCWEPTDAAGIQENAKAKRGRRKPASRGVESGSEETARPARTGGARKARVGSARTAGRSDRVGRRGADAPVQPTDTVVELPWSPTGSSGGGRKAHRIRTRPAKGDGGRPEQGREDSDGGEGDGV